NATRVRTMMRVGLPALGVALLVVSAATSSVALRDAGGDGAERVSEALVADALSPARRVSRDLAGGAAEDAMNPIPRPEHWDGGALARLAQGVTGADGTVLATGKTVAPCPEAPAVAPPAAAPAQDVGAADADVESRLSGAFRPSTRGASAAN